MDVDLITPETEQLLLSSLRAAITDVNGGMSPNDALIKHAKDSALGPELACRLTEAFNTSKTLHRLHNTVGEKRAETFALADRDVVVAGLYTGVEKAAGVVRYNDPSQVNFNHLEKDAGWWDDIKRWWGKGELGQIPKRQAAATPQVPPAAGMPGTPPAVPPTMSIGAPQLAAATGPVGVQPPAAPAMPTPGVPGPATQPGLPKAAGWGDTVKGLLPGIFQPDVSAPWWKKNIPQIIGDSMLPKLEEAEDNAVYRRPPGVSTHPDVTRIDPPTFPNSPAPAQAPVNPATAVPAATPRPWYQDRLDTEKALAASKPTPPPPTTSTITAPALATPSAGTAAPNPTTPPGAPAKPVLAQTPKYASDMSQKTEYVKKSLYGIEENAIRAGRGFIKDISNARDEYRMRTKQAKETAASSLHAFVQAFHRADRNDMSALKDVEERLSYHFGTIAKKAIDLAWDELPEKIQQREKRAEHIPTTHVYPLNDPLYKLGANMIHALQAAGDLAAEFTVFDKKASLVEDHYNGQLNTLMGYTPKDPKRPFVPSEKKAEEGDLGYGDVSDNSADLQEKTEKKPKTDFERGVAHVTDIPKTMGIGQADPKGRSVKRQIPIFPVEHEGRLRAIKSKLMINDMISNDPIISGYPVESVLEVYNRISEMLPALATQPIAMRGLLASMLQRGGGLEALEVKGLLDTEESARKLRVLGA